MMQGETSASPLAEFLLLAKSAKGAACAQLVLQVLEHPSIHVFGELLDMPNVREVRDSPRLVPHLGSLSGSVHQEGSRAGPG